MRNILSFCEFVHLRTLKGPKTYFFSQLLTLRSEVVHERASVRTVLVISHTRAISLACLCFCPRRFEVGGVQLEKGDVTNFDGFSNI